MGDVTNAVSAGVAFSELILEVAWTAALAIVSAKDRG
jgi:hypothetical protein